MFVMDGIEKGKQPGPIIHVEIGDNSSLALTVAELHRASDR